MGKKELSELKQKLINALSRADSLIDETHALKTKVIENETKISKLQLEIMSLQKEIETIEDENGVK